VVVKTLANKRGVITEAGASGRYRVRIEGVTVWCREEDLAPADQPGESKTAARRKMRRSSPPAAESSGDRRGTHRPGDGEHGAHGGRLDLHGFRVAEALARVDDEINRALLRGADRLEIVHGRGTGRIREALHRHLASITVVAAFRLDSRNPGVTWVHF
jgi:DNA mismatch repair protein MutS2